MEGNIVVIGGSAGAINGLIEIVSKLPATLNSALFVVIHFPANGKSLLPQILNNRKTLPAIHAVNGEKIEAGKIYIAPPDFHLIIEKGKMLLSKGPKENNFRPAVDVLFRSAALAYGPLVTGVILSGALDDGTAGLNAVKKCGGTSIVQDPKEIIIKGMPENALKYSVVDYCVSVSQIPLLLEQISGKKEIKHSGMKTDKVLQWELDMAKGTKTDLGIKKYGQSTRFVCPECQGPLFKLNGNDKLPRYRCYLGHAYSAQTLMDEISKKVDHLLWTVFHALDEKRDMISNLGKTKHILTQEKKKIDKYMIYLRKILDEKQT